MQETKQRVREFYDEVGWRQDADGLYQNARFEDMRPVSREYIHKCHLRVNRYIAPAGKYLLDAGSGPLQWPEYLTYSEGYLYRICADISITALKAARSILGSRGLYVVADIANLPFKSGAVDGIVSIHAVHHLGLAEQRKAYLEFHRVLQAEGSAAIVSGWYRPLLMRVSDPLIQVGRFLSGRAAKQKRDWMAAEDQQGTFVEKLTPAWLERQLGHTIRYETYTWRSLSPRFMQWFIRPQTGGETWLRIIFWLEDRFPHFFGRYGQYPLIVVHKDAGSDPYAPKRS
jgi:SAM-dependent methyltransferase